MIQLEAALVPAKSDWYKCYNFPIKKQKILRTLLKRKTIHGHEFDEYKRDPVCENLNLVLDVGNFS